MNRHAAVKKLPTQNRAQKTRALLLAVTEKLVETEGADAVTTTRVAALSGVSVGTIYRYFDRRTDLLLAAYDETVERIVLVCIEWLDRLQPDTPATEAAAILLGVYLDTADAIPAHAGLLAAMRHLRPVEMDMNNTGVGDRLLSPFLTKISGGKTPDAQSVHFINVLLSTLVDFYLITPGVEERARLRSEIQAHMQLALARATQ